MKDLIVLLWIIIFGIAISIIFPVVGFILAGFLVLGVLDEIAKKNKYK